ncbi:MAG: hypothetical protein HC888_15300, partial [Candidatus Competibacteraceae bacterium]|nr:hypothetical protein [Candidatus Competibacteraceae bacterium]
MQLQKDQGTKQSKEDEGDQAFQRLAVGKPDPAQAHAHKGGKGIANHQEDAGQSDRDVGKRQQQ